MTTTAEPTCTHVESFTVSDDTDVTNYESTGDLIISNGRVTRGQFDRGSVAVLMDGYHAEVYVDTLVTVGELVTIDAAILHLTRVRDELVRMAR